MYSAHAPNVAQNRYQRVPSVGIAPHCDVLRIEIRVATCVKALTFERKASSLYCTLEVGHADSVLLLYDNPDGGNISLIILRNIASRG